MNAIVPTLCLVVATAAAAHDFWLDAETFRPETDSNVAIFIRGGHYFPSSEIALADRLISTFVAEHGNKHTDVESLIDGKQRLATLAIKSDDVHRLTLAIRRPREEEPVAWASLLLIPSGATSDITSYPRGIGLEIVPRARLEEVRKGKAMSFSILRDGAPIRAKFQILAAAGGATWLEAHEGEPALFTPRKTGRHLAIVNDRNQTATLVFEVLP